MNENKTDEGYILMAAAMMRVFTKDVIHALRLRPPWDQKELDALRIEAECGAMSYILDVAHLDFDDVVEQAKMKMEGKGYGC